MVLGHVARYPGLTAHAIARALGFSYPPDYTGGGSKAGASLARLQAARLVTWEPGTADGRKRKLWRLHDAH
jgi:hypothetical protein